MSVSPYASQARSFDNFIYGMAVTNHANYLSSNWDLNTNPSVCHKIAAYLAGMVEHLCFLVIKVVTFVGFIFINIALTFHYLASYCQNVTEATATKRKIRLFVGLLVMGEAATGSGIDVLGIACPPLAYRAHEFMKLHVTRRCFEKWGVIDHSMSEMDFAALDFFGKM